VGCGTVQLANPASVRVEKRAYKQSNTEGKVRLCKVADNCGKVTESSFYQTERTGYLHQALNNTRSTDTTHYVCGFSGSTEQNRLYSVFQKYVA
jgi:hypothetical protein